MIGFREKPRTDEQTDGRTHMGQSIGPTSFSRIIHSVRNLKISCSETKSPEMFPCNLSAFTFFLGHTHTNKIPVYNTSLAVGVH